MRSKLPPLLLATFFSIIALFGTPIHDHDLDSSHLDLDCISCHLVQSNIGVENDGPYSFRFTEFTPLVVVPEMVSHATYISFSSSRAPPVFC